jgi:hypothetical protein
VWAVILLAIVPLALLAFVACDDDDDEDGDGDGNGSATTAPAGDGDELSLYFNDVAAIQGELTDGVDTIGEQSQSAFGDPAQARQTLSAILDAGNASLEEFNALDPPAEAADAHAAVADAGEAYLAVVQGLSDDLQGMEAGPEFDAFKEDVQSPDSEFSAAKADMQAACDEMQAVADDNSIDVALECPV